MRSIAIIGGGFSGTAFAAQLLRSASSGDFRVYLIERSREIARGLAYSTDDPSHLLNVPAGNMSAFPSEPAHFVDWLRNHSAACDTGRFVPRLLYAKYLRELLASGSERLELISDEATRIRQDSDRFRIDLQRGRHLMGDVAVLALGNFPPANPRVEDDSFYASKLYRSDSWRPGALNDIMPDRPVFLIGAGLTMVDTTLSLLNRRHVGKIHAISRHGLLPRRHRLTEKLALPNDFNTHASPRQLLRWVRDTIDHERSRGLRWQGVIDALRPVTQALWQNASPPERARFVRHLRPWWDVHRHRLAPEVADLIDAAVNRGQLIFHAGTILRYAVNDDRVTVEFRRRGSDDLASIDAGYVINCSGPATDYERLADPLVRNLLDDGMIRADPLHLGVDVTSDLRVIDRNGNPSKNLYAIGPMTKGTFWEIAAVPDIRSQCETLAHTIAA